MRKGSVTTCDAGHWPPRKEELVGIKVQEPLHAGSLGSVQRLLQAISC